MAHFQQTTYEVQRHTGQCALTGKPFRPGDRYIAALVESADELRRVDLSEEAWNQGHRPEGLFSHWRAVAPTADQAKPKLFVDDEVLMNLLERLADAEQPQRIAFRFVLALILMRKKLLRYDGVETLAGSSVDDSPRPDQNWWLLTPKLDLSKGPLGKWDESRRLTVLDPHLDEAGVRGVTEQLSDILRAEL